MSLFDPMRTRAIARLMRQEPVLVVPAGAGSDRVDGYVRQWSPDAVRRNGTVLVIVDGVELLGPFGRTDPRWPDPRLPARFEAAYVTRSTPRSDDTSLDDTRYDLLDGLARRLSGLVREQRRSLWVAAPREPVIPLVLAPRRLTAEEAIGVLSAHYPGLLLGDQDDESYRLYAGGYGVLLAELAAPSIFPHVARQSWFTGKPATTEYCLYHGDTPEGPRHTADAARTLAHATGGMVLDEDGFPYEPG